MNAPPPYGIETTQSSNRIRVGVDFHTFEGPYQGSRSRLLAIFRHLVAEPGELDFVLFSRRPDELREALGDPDPERVRCVKLASRGPIGRLAFELRHLSAKHSLDVFHGQYILPIGLGCASVVTIHDVLFESHPEFFPRRFVWRSRLLTRRAARRADHVITVSAYSAREIQERYGVEPGRITVSPNAVDRARFRPEALDAETLAGRDLAPGGYVLSVGRVDKRKNFGRIIEACSGPGGIDLPLVIVGSPGSERDLVTLERRMQLSTGRVVHLVDVADDELASLYAGAAAVVMGSQAEGFGMPALEAMASGAPLISSNRTALPEVCADAAEFFDPLRTDELRTALRTVLGDAERRAELIERGLGRAERFSWLREAEAVRGIYLRVGGALAANGRSTAA